MSNLIQLILSNILNTTIYTSWITHHPLHHEGKLLTFGSVGSNNMYAKNQDVGRNGKELRYPSKL
jgi:hypothetical protein